MIQVQGLSKSFGNVKAVQEVSFAAPDGQITGLLGPNGAGKSTTLRMLYTLLKPDSGSAQVDGFDVQTSPLEVQRRIGVLADALGLRVDRLLADNSELQEYVRQLEASEEASAEPPAASVEPVAPDAPPCSVPAFAPAFPAVSGAGAVSRLDPLPPSVPGVSALSPVSAFAPAAAGSWLWTGEGEACGAGGVGVGVAMGVGLGCRGDGGPEVEARDVAQPSARPAVR